MENKEKVRRHVAAMAFYLMVLGISKGTFSFGLKKKKKLTISTHKKYYLTGKYIKRNDIYCWWWRCQHKSWSMTIADGRREHGMKFLPISTWMGIIKVRTRRRNSIPRCRHGPTSFPDDSFIHHHHHKPIMQFLWFNEMQVNFVNDPFRRPFYFLANRAHDQWPIGPTPCLFLIRAFLLFSPSLFFFLLLYMPAPSNQYNRVDSFSPHNPKK